MEPECETFEAARDEHIEKAQAHYKALHPSTAFLIDERLRPMIPVCQLLLALLH